MTQLADPGVELTEDVGGFPVGLGEGAQCRTQLPHDGGGVRPSTFHVTDDQTHTPGRERDRVVEVTADLCQGAVSVRFQRPGG